MFTETPAVAFDPDTRRIYLHHGPIDMFAEIDSDEINIQADAAKMLGEKFKNVLPSLCEELPILRSNVDSIVDAPASIVGRKMFDSAVRFSAYDIVTPMIAVAGSVADYICDLIDAAFTTRRIIVNNGGDIAFRLGEGQTMSAGICDDISRPEISATVTLDDNSGVGGIATSGWKGRSFSLGIADAVTVLAETAAQADAAATLIANAVDLPGSRKVEREAARRIAPDSDLGDRKVTVLVSALADEEKQAALDRGMKVARTLSRARLVHSAYLTVQGSRRILTCH